MRVLLVEDDRRLSAAVCKLLEKERIAVDPVYDGNDGLDWALGGEYDAVILDVMLPGMDGFSVLRELRKEKVSAPVLMLTARASLEDRLTGLDSGADYYLPKPFESAELVSCLRAITRRGNRAPVMSLKDGMAVGKLTILSDQTARLVVFIKEIDINGYIADILPHAAAVHKDKAAEVAGNAHGMLQTAETTACTGTGQSVKLGAKEFQLMEIFLRNPAQILPRETLQERVWGLDSDAEYNSLEVYVSFLRKKLGFIASRMKIRATRGVGYSLEEET